MPGCALAFPIPTPSTMIWNKAEEFENIFFRQISSGQSRSEWPSTLWWFLLLLLLLWSTTSERGGGIGGERGMERERDREGWKWATYRSKYPGWSSNTIPRSTRFEETAQRLTQKSKIADIAISANLTTKDCCNSEGNAFSRTNILCTRATSRGSRGVQRSREAGTPG